MSPVCLYVTSFIDSPCSVHRPRTVYDYLYPQRQHLRPDVGKAAAGLTTNMIANMGKGEHISMKTLLRICEALNCGILDVIELTQDEEN